MDACWKEFEITSLKLEELESNMKKPFLVQARDRLKGEEREVQMTLNTRYNSEFCYHKFTKNFNALFSQASILLSMLILFGGHNNHKRGYQYDGHFTDEETDAQGS